MSLEMCMMFLLKSVIILVICQCISAQPQCGFRAAVYEHASGLPKSSAVETLTSNLDVYEAQVAAAAQQAAVIIVFPEDGLTSPTWDETNEEYFQKLPTSNGTLANPCLSGTGDNQTLVAYRLSCMARNHSIMVVANFPTAEPCDADDPCPSRGEYHYNTDVIFAADGTLMARYHKVNLYGEPEFDPSPNTESVYVDTPFGRLGVVTCFDLLWKEPTVTLVEQYEIDTLLFPTGWMDQLPFLTSVQAQAAWAAGLRVNLLAANLHIPIGGFMGSGIYAGIQGPVKYVYDADASNGTLIVADLPCSSWEHAAVTPIGLTARYHRLKYQDLSVFDGKSLEDINGTARACQGSLCCEATYTQTSSPEGEQSGRYILAVHQGNVSEDDLYTFSAEICSVLWCPSDELIDCTRQPSNVTSSFRHLELVGNFTTSYVYPSVLTEDLQLAPSTLWQYKPTLADSEQAQYASLTISSQGEPLSVTTAALYGRRYDLDPSQ